MIIKALLPIAVFLFLMTMCLHELPKAIDTTLDYYQGNTPGIDREAVLRGQQ